MQQPRQPGEPVNSDPFMKPVPGWSLTQPPGKWPWEKPPRFTDPDEVVDRIIKKLEDERVQENYVKLMFAGVSIEEIVHSISVTGFAEGEFTPDVAEIIKAPIGIYLMGVATDNDVPVKLFADEPALRQDQKGLDDSTILDLMKSRNPEFYKFLNSDFEDPEEIQRMNREQQMSQGFLAVEMPVGEEMLSTPEDDMGEDEE